MIDPRESTVAAGGTGIGIDERGEPRETSRVTLSQPPRSIDSLQIGMNWFSERPGGLDRVVATLVQSLPAAGVAVRGMVAGTPAVSGLTGGVVEAFADAEAPMLQRLRQSRDMARRLVAQRRPDLVAAHFALYAAPCLGVLKSIPKVIHFHGPWAEEAVTGKQGAKFLAQRGLERHVYGAGARHIVLSNAFGDVLKTQYRVSADTIRVVPGGVDVDQFDQDIQRRDARLALGLPLDRPLLFCVRRLVSRMGLEDLIDAIDIVRQAIPDVLLTIAGKGPLMASLQARIETRGVSSFVRLAGFVPDEALPLWYRAADISVVPTIALEGFGLTTIESLASGTPVLVTPIGGLPEAVSPLSPNLVLESSGAKAIADGLVDALSGNRSLPDTSQCRAYARANFDLPVIAAKTRAVYLEAIQSQ